MPYIALQLVGMQIVLGALGVDGDWPLIIAFVILAAYTYQSGLRAPALIAVVKDTLIYVTILVAVIYIPSKIGGFGAMFDAADKALPTRDKPGSLIPEGADAQVAYATLAFGSALALFLYPHAITAVLGAKSAQTVRRNTALLPAYTFLLGLIALLGYMAIARGIEPERPELRRPRPVPQRLPVVVRRLRVRGDRDRRARARGGHVDRRREPLHALDLQGVPAPGRRRTPTRRGSRRSSRCSSRSARS